MKFWAQKRECGPKKNSMGGGQYCPAEIYPEKFAQTLVRYNPSFFAYRISIYAIEVVRKIYFLR